MEGIKSEIVVTRNTWNPFSVNVNYDTKMLEKLQMDTSFVREFSFKALSRTISKMAESSRGTEIPNSPFAIKETPDEFLSNLKKFISSYAKLAQTYSINPKEKRHFYLNLKIASFGDKVNF
jgi:hypothetical protein